MQELIKFIENEMGQELSPYTSKHGDIFTMNDFLEMVDATYIMDDDGYGEYLWNGLAGIAFPLEVDELYQFTEIKISVARSIEKSKNSEVIAIVDGVSFERQTEGILTEVTNFELTREQFLQLPLSVAWYNR